MMNKKLKKTGGLVIAIMALLMFTVPAITQAALPFGFGVLNGISGPAFGLTAKADTISVPDGALIPMWGYSDDSGSGVMQYPGPTLIVAEGDLVTVTLTNTLDVPTSIVFPGHEVTTSGGAQGVLTAEAAALGGVVTYSFTATNPGTYTYYSGTNMDLQVEMGLMGVIIVRPTGYIEGDPSTYTAYGTPESAYDVEYLEIFDDVDHDIHDAVATGNPYNTNTNYPRYWFFNGRAFPDTIDHNLAGATQAVPWLPNQPYNALTLAVVGQKILVRVVGAGNDFHPQHYHGNNGKIIARDGRLLETPLGADQLFEDINTLIATPGQTSDMLWTWVGQDLDWDYYGHDLSDSINEKEVLAITTTFGVLGDNGLGTDTSLTITGWGPPVWDSTEILSDDGVVPSTHKINAIIYSGPYPHLDPTAEMVTLLSTGGLVYDVERAQNGTASKEWPAGSQIAYTDHGQPFPVILPELQDLTFGPVYHGSPFLGAAGTLPPGEGGLNPFNAFGHPWHVHHEKNLVNNDVFVGGLFTVILLLPNGPVSAP